ncbi:MAG: anti-sigma factor [Gemmatimonadaceae bacterium]|nr:anti-sigma factor [Gemmatimonadaceae bacterium]
MQNDMDDERLGELLMQRATGALSAPEADALTQALARMPAGEVARWEAAAAELVAAFAETDPASLEPLPPQLAERIVSTGQAVVRSQPRGDSPIAVRSPMQEALPPRRSLALAWGGWFAAAAALLLWFAPPRSTASVTVRPPVASTVAQLRDSLITLDSATRRLEWTTTGDSAAIGATGDVVWSDRAQRGVMRIAGLKANDRARWQYQVWIFDTTRDQKYPVDGGVFDIPAGQTEVLVPIDARVPVGDAVMFAVTVEPAGGVVVSTRERIALLAQRRG